MNGAYLPPLREELSLYPGPALSTGEPSHILEDPVRNQFFRLDWITYEIVKRWSYANADDILQSIRAQTPLSVGGEDVAATLAFLDDNQLIRPDPLASVKPMAARQRAVRGTWYARLLHNYLYFRIPLVKPDRWLDRAAPALSWLFGPAFLRLSLLALLLGLMQVARSWDQFCATLVDTFTPGGIAAYAAALVAVKCAHELGHALTAKRYGCRVPAMGVAFMVLWPVPYTDTNDAWRLRERRHRLRIAAAGVATELLIAAWSTLAWALLPDGAFRQIAFVLATTSWIATLAINASPFMRFDGYFVLSDWLDMPNLHARAFALARWDLRERLFALGEPPPEYFSPRRHAGLILFAWSVWLYRLILFIGIAVLVYHFFIKLVGILLFAVEMSWFVLRPIAAEMRVWRDNWARIRKSRRAQRTAFWSLIAIVLFVLPWPTRIQAGAVLRPAQVHPIHAPAHARVAALPVPEGGKVKAGQAMLQLAVAESDSRRDALRAQIARLDWQAASAAFDAEQRAHGTVLREELATAEAQLALLDEEAKKHQPIAPFDGTLRDLDPDLRPGTWLSKGERIAVLVNDDGSEVSTYLDEETVRRVAVGNDARFYADGLEGPYVRLTVTGIDHDASRTLPSGMWVAQHGGTVAARDKQGVWYPERAVYQVRLAVSGDAGSLAGRAWRGQVVIAGDWEAPGARFMRSLASLLRREAGF